MVLSRATTKELRRIEAIRRTAAVTDFFELDLSRLLGSSVVVTSSDGSSFDFAVVESVETVDSFAPLDLGVDLRSASEFILAVPVALQGGR